MTGQEWALIITAIGAVIVNIIKTELAAKLANDASKQAAVNAANITNLTTTADGHTADIRSLNEQATATALATPAVVVPASTSGVTASVEPLQTTGGSI